MTPKAKCKSCGWVGDRKDLQVQPGCFGVTYLCPECNTNDVLYPYFGGITYPEEENNVQHEVKDRISQGEDPADITIQ